MAGALVKFVGASCFANLARRIEVQSEKLGNGDPHLSLDWFALLAETALPYTSELALCQVGPSSFLALMRLPGSPLVTGVSTFYSPLFGLAGHGDATSDFLADIAKELIQRKMGVAEVRLAPMDRGSVSWKKLQQAFCQTGWLVSHYYCFGNWVHAVGEGGYAAYLASRPGALRNTLRRRQRKLAAVDGVNLHIYTGAESDLDTAINDFVAVYAVSWKEPEHYPEFIPALCRLAAKQGGLRLGVLKIAEQVAAAQLWLVANDTAYIVKLAYDPAFALHSPGTVLSASLFERVIDVDQVKVIDYLIGDDPYKRDWMSERRERYGLVAFNPRSWSGAYGALRHWVGKFYREGRGAR